jgi:hypothetical protein
VSYQISYVGFVSRIGKIAVRSATMSTWRLQPVFSKTPRMGADCVQRKATIRGDVLHGFSGCKTAGDTRLRWREIEQRLHQFSKQLVGGFVLQGHAILWRAAVAASVTVLGGSPAPCELTLVN